ncbi:MAG: biopolymer transporter ExbD [Gammaproteobacteria bacterium]|nr:biopolymer transporter ExbD [Gammaproteobacteria bacterium]
MAFGGFSQEGGGDMAEINVIPLVDIMLVLLVIFIITAPVITHSVKVDLPRVSHERNEVPPQAVTLSLDADGALYWDQEPLAAESLESRLERAVAEQPELELHLRADQHTPYERLARVLTQARAAGVLRIGFITEPEGGAR